MMTFQALNHIPLFDIILRDLRNDLWRLPHDTLLSLLPSDAHLQCLWVIRSA